MIDVVAVELREVLRDLPLAERVVERVVDQLRRDAEARGLIAVDRRASASCPAICWSVATSRSSGKRLQLVEHLRRPGVELVEVGVLQRVLVLRARGAAADVHVLRRLQEQLARPRPCRASAAAAR